MKGNKEMSAPETQLVASGRLASASEADSARHISGQFSQRLLLTCRFMPKPLMTAHCTALLRLLALHACPTGQHCCLSAATCCGVYTYLCGHYLVTPLRQQKTTVLTSQVKVSDQTMWTASPFNVWKRAGVNQIQQSSCKQMRSKGSDKVVAQTPRHHTESVVLQFQA